jgi:hypothetical protein
VLIGRAVRLQRETPLYFIRDRARASGLAVNEDPVGLAGDEHFAGRGVAELVAAQRADPAEVDDPRGDGDPVADEGGALGLDAG